MCYDVGLMHGSGCHCQGHLKDRSLTCNDFDSLFQILLVSRLVFGADFEFSCHLNIYEAALVPI